MLLDKYLPVYDFTEVHSIRVKADPKTAFKAVNEVTLGEISFIVRLLFFLRSLPEKALVRKGIQISSQGPLLGNMIKNGFTKIDEQKPEEIVFGVIVPGDIGRFWKKSGKLGLHMKTANEFLAFKNPDYLWVVANFLVKDSSTPGLTIVSTESRTWGLSPRARRNFVSYWRIIRPFSGLIRRFMLRGIKHRAEREYAGHLFGPEHHPAT